MATHAEAGSATDEYRTLAQLARELTQIMRDGGLFSLELQHGDLRITLQSAGAQPQVVAVAQTPAAEPAPDGHAQPGGYLISSPMIGTFYAAAAPGDRPFVEVGDRVEPGQTVAIIEAMKIMNEIVAERGGEVTEIFVTNGEAVEYGHPLLRLREE
ncbi:MAG TPA: acetyl-CoA carboxylase biotin carboxyl carrier protein [Thermomicrobiaceae bacterium]|nr:acetyl-CoA carboxylase biotin carboxyl carrier protein [Thermomicrobiaceae bacterium]